MKKGKLFSTFALAFLAIGVGASLIGTHDVVRADALAEEPEVVEAKSYYVDFSYETTWFNDNGARLFAFVMQGDGKTYNAWSEELVKAPGEEEVEMFTLPVLPEGATAWDRATIVRFNPQDFVNPKWEHEHWNQTIDFDLPTAPNDSIKVLDAKQDGKNKVEAIKYVPTAERGVMSGEKIYFDIKARAHADRDPFTYWTDADAKVAVQVVAKEGSAFTKFMVPATGKYQGIENLFEATLPQINGKNVLFQKATVGRYAPETEENALSFDEGKYWAKTMEINFNSKNDLVLISHNSKEGEINIFWSGVETTVDYDAAVAFATTFNKSLGSVCKMDGSTNAQELKNAFDEQSKEFNKLSARAKEIVKHNRNGQDGELQTALERYDYIVTHYANEVAVDFLGRRPQNASHGLSITEDYTTLIIVATVVAVAAISVIAVVAIRKKQLSK